MNYNLQIASAVAAAVAVADCAVVCEGGDEGSMPSGVTG